MEPTALHNQPENCKEGKSFGAGREEEGEETEGEEEEEAAASLQISVSDP